MGYHCAGCWKIVTRPEGSVNEPYCRICFRDKFGNSYERYVQHLAKKKSL